MARTLETELARLSRAVRRRVLLLTPRHAAPIKLTPRDRLILAWDQTAGRVLRWLRNGWA